MNARKLLTVCLMTLGSLALSAPRASAVPILQLYLEGATYDATSETWVLEGDADVLRLWTIGNVDGEGGKGTIYDVKLAVAYAAGATPTITLTPSTTGGYGGYLDPSTPSAPTLIQTVTDGSVPQLGDGSDLPSHGEYGAGTHWQEFSLGDFSLTDSQINDFISSFPPASGGTEGQINVYEVSVAGYSGAIHFDLYDHYYAKNGAKYVFAPFSHDGEGDCCTQVPEPATMSMLGSAMAALGGAFAVRRRQRA